MEFRSLDDHWFLTVEKLTFTKQVYIYKKSVDVFISAV